MNVIMKLFIFDIIKYYVKYFRLVRFICLFIHENFGMREETGLK